MISAPQFKAQTHPDILMSERSAQNHSPRGIFVDDQHGERQQEPKAAENRHRKSGIDVGDRFADARGSNHAIAAFMSLSVEDGQSPALTTIAGVRFRMTSWN